MAKAKGSSQNFWGMVEKVLIASMNKGQAPLFVVAGVIALMIWKMPGEDVSKLVFRLVDAFETGYFVGYGLFVVVTAGWFVHAKYQRQSIVREMRRITDERNRLQGPEIESSE